MSAVVYCTDWREPRFAPFKETVIAWGNGCLRFMYQDENGQWRNMNHAPRPAPKVWCFPPAPPEEK